MDKIFRATSTNWSIQGITCFAALLLGATPPAWAGYNPPTQPSAPSGSTTTTGRRGGCQGNEAASLAALAPRSHIGQSISTRPTFTWFVPSSEALPMEFYLYEAQASGEQLVYQTELQSSPGIMSLSLPETEPALQTGQRYRWQAVLLCNPNSPSSALIADAEIEIVAPSSDLATALGSASDRVAQANILAESGFWYDAIAQVADAPDVNIRASQLALLADLADIEAANGNSDHSTQLRQIIEFEQ